MRVAQLPKGRVPEKAEQAAIVELLRTIGGRVYVLGTVRRHGDHPGTMQTPGLPDVLAFLPTRLRTWMVLAVEVKAKGGRLRPAQEQFRAVCEQSPMAYVTGGLDVVIGWLEEQKYLNRGLAEGPRREDGHGIRAKSS